MNAVEVAIRFTIAWLGVGLGLFIALGSLRALRPVAVPTEGRRASWQRQYAVPLILGLGLLAFAFVEAMKAVPW